jgi:hypothetical protein
MREIELISRDGDRIALVPAKAFFEAMASWPEGFCERVGEGSYQVSLSSRTMLSLANGRSPKGLLRRLNDKAPKWAALRSGDRHGRASRHSHDADGLTGATVGDGGRTGSGGVPVSPDALLLDVDANVLANFRRSCELQGRDMASTIEALMASFSRHAGVA